MVTKAQGAMGSKVRQGAVAIRQVQRSGMAAANPWAVQTCARCGHVRTTCVTSTPASPCDVPFHRMPAYRATGIRRRVPCLVRHPAVQAVYTAAAAVALALRCGPSSPCWRWSLPDAEVEARIGFGSAGAIFTTGTQDAASATICGGDNVPAARPLAPTEEAPALRQPAQRSRRCDTGRHRVANTFEHGSEDRPRSCWPESMVDPGGRPRARAGRQPGNAGRRTPDHRPIRPRRCPTGVVRVTDASREARRPGVAARPPDPSDSVGHAGVARFRQHRFSDHSRVRTSDPACRSTSELAGGQLSRIGQAARRRAQRHQAGHGAGVSVTTRRGKIAARGQVQSQGRRAAARRWRRSTRSLHPAPGVQRFAPAGLCGSSSSEIVRSCARSSSLDSPNLLLRLRSDPAVPAPGRAGLPARPRSRRERRRRLRTLLHA